MTPERGAAPGESPGANAETTCEDEAYRSGVSIGDVLFALVVNLRRPVPAMPGRGSARVEWLQGLDEVLAADVLATSAEMRRAGWSAAGAHDAIVGTFATYMAARVTDAIAMAADVAVLRERGAA